jgi:hypothetical protein
MGNKVNKNKFKKLPLGDDKTLRFIAQTYQSKNELSYTRA